MAVTNDFHKIYAFLTTVWK